MTDVGARGGAATSGGVDLPGRAQRNAMLVAVGSVLATLAVIISLLALTAASRGVTTTSARPWVVVLLVCAALMGALCVVQQRLWLRAWNVWSLDPGAFLGERVSWVVHLLSYPVLVLGIFAGVAASHDVDFAGAVANWSAIALVPLIGAQVVGAVRYVSHEGPPGTVPTHVRRLAARIERSRHDED